MKLRTISETVVADPDQILSLLGTAASKLFGLGKNRKLPNRLPRKTQREVNYTHETPMPGKKCQSCKYFDKQPGTIHKCKIVEGDISAGGWCRLYE